MVSASRASPRPSGALGRRLRSPSRKSSRRGSPRVRPPNSMAMGAPPCTVGYRDWSTVGRPSVHLAHAAALLHAFAVDRHLGQRRHDQFDDRDVVSHAAHGSVPAAVLAAVAPGPIAVASVLASVSIVVVGVGPTTVIGGAVIGIV